MRTMFSMLLVAAVAAAAPPAVLAAEEPGPTADAIDRELVVRFSRAYGMAKGVVAQRDDVDEDASLQDPERVDDDGLRQELYQIIDTNGLTPDEWQGMIARMETDAELRDRVESLSTPFMYE